MFLNQLEQKTKNVFLEVCAYAAMANDVLEKEEEETMYAYCREMNICERMPNRERELSELLSYLSENANNCEKKIIILEILGLMKIDGVYDNREKEFMNILVDGLQMKKSILSKLEKLLDSYMNLYKEIYSVISE